MAQPRPFTDYTIGIICALSVEKAAMDAMLDEIHAPNVQVPNDNHIYTFGQLGSLPVVVACLPAGKMGTNSAATVATHMCRSFPSVKVGLMVGVGGGVWSKQHDIRLGDVVVSMPDGTCGGVVQWDFGKIEKGGEARKTGVLNQPPPLLLSAAQAVRVRQEKGESQLSAHLESVLKGHPAMKEKYEYQGSNHDVLFERTYDHPGGDTCDACAAERQVQRAPRANGTPKVHYGIIASGNRVVKDAQFRDSISKIDGSLCFEMEAAGLMDQLPCIVIRGICDYADSHKNKRWQPYAAATAAAYAKELLSFVQVRSLEQEVLATVETKGNEANSVPAFYHVPKTAVSKFFGREQIMRELEAYLEPHPSRNDQPKVAILQAMGGQGKSQVALRLCRRLRGQCHGIFWINATSKETAEQEFEEIADKLNESGKRQLEDSKARIRFVLDRIEKWEKRWLFIYDNYDTPGLFPSIKEFMPESGYGSVLITSRNEETKELGRVYKLHSMLDDGGLQLLLRHMRADEQDNNRHAGIEILKRLGGLALALEQAAAYMDFYKCSPQDFRKEYDAKKDEILAYTRDGIWDYRKDDQALSAITTWEISFRLVEENDPERKKDIEEFLSIAAYLDPSCIQESLFQLYIGEHGNPQAWGRPFETFYRGTNINSGSESTGDSSQFWVWSQLKQLLGWSGPIKPKSIQQKTLMDPTKLRETVTKLHNLSLIQIIDTDTEMRFSIHPAIRDWLQIRRGGRSVQTIILQNALKFITAEVRYRKQDHPYDWSFLQKFQTHFDSILMNSRNNNLEHGLGSAQMMFETFIFGFYFAMRGHYNRAIELFGSLVPDDWKSLDAYDAWALFAMEMLAHLHLFQDQFNKAEELQLQVIRAKEHALGEEDEEVVKSKLVLASILIEQGRWEESMQLKESVMKATEQGVQLGLQGKVDHLDNISQIYYQQGEFQKAEELGLSMLKEAERECGPHHPATCDIMETIADGYIKQGKYEPAEQFLRSAIARRKTYGGNSIEYTNALKKLVWVYHAQRRWERSKECLLELKAVWPKVFEEDSQLSYIATEAFAEMLLDIGELDEAIERMAQCVDMSTRIELDQSQVLRCRKRLQEWKDNRDAGHRQQ